MLDIKFLRENPEVVKQNIRNKFQDEKLPMVDEVIALDQENRDIKQEVDALRAERNKQSKEIGKLMGQGKREEAEEIKKGETEIPDGGRRKTVNDHELLVFGYAKFKKRVQGKWPWLSYSALTTQLCDMGVMTCREGMDYSTIKVGEKAVNVAAFYTEELKKQA